MKKHIVSILFGFFAAVSCIAPAGATVLNTPWQSTAFNFADLDGSQSVSFNGFNTALGNLVGVSLKFVLNETLSNIVFNLGKAANIGNPLAVSATSTITATGPLGLTTVNQLTTPGFKGVASTGYAVIGTTSLRGFEVGPNTLNGDAVSLAKYIGGTNSVTINLTSAGTQSGSLARDVLTGYFGSADGVVSLQYLYDRSSYKEIPEPGAIALLALGLLVLSQWRRRKR